MVGLLVLKWELIAIKMVQGLRNAIVIVDIETVTSGLLAGVVVLMV